jgi:hypothetical protein
VIRIDYSCTGAETVAMVAANRLPGIGVDCVPPECPGKSIDGTVRPGGEFAGALTDFFLQMFGREIGQLRVRQSVITNGVATRRKIANLGWSHRLPILVERVSGH